MHPIVTTLSSPFGPIPIYSFGLCLTIGVLGAWYIALPHVKEGESLPARGLAKALLAGLAGALLFGHIVDAAIHGGQVLAGGIDGAAALFGGLMVLIALRTPWSPRLVHSASVFLSCLGLGHFLHGSHFGRVWESAPGWLSSLTRFPQWQEHQGSPAFQHQLELGLLAADVTEALPTIPVAAASTVLPLLCGLVAESKDRAAAIFVGLFALGDAALTLARPDIPQAQLLLHGGLLVVAWQLGKRAPKEFVLSPSGASSEE